MKFWFNRRQLLKAIFRGGLMISVNDTFAEWRYGAKK